MKWRKWSARAWLLAHGQTSIPLITMYWSSWPHNKYPVLRLWICKKALQLAQSGEKPRAQHRIKEHCQLQKDHYWLRWQRLAAIRPFCKIWPVKRRSWNHLFGKRRNSGHRRQRDQEWPIMPRKGRLYLLLFYGFGIFWCEAGRGRLYPCNWLQKAVFFIAKLVMF